MTPMTPIVPPTPPPKLRAPLSGLVKLILGLKVAGCLVVLFGSMLALAALSNKPLAPEMAHQLSTLLTLSSGAAAVQLVAVAGVWSFKRWGVYLLVTIGLLAVVFDMKAGSTFSAALGISTLLFVGFAIAGRWNDFE